MLGHGDPQDMALAMTQRGDETLSVPWDHGVGVPRLARLCSDISPSPPLHTTVPSDLPFGFLPLEEAHGLQQNEGQGLVLDPARHCKGKETRGKGKLALEADTWVQIPALPFPSWVLGPLNLSEPWLPHL